MMDRINSRCNNASQEFKKCAGKDCEKPGRITLKIKYVNKIGLFCDSCAEDLTSQDLAIQIGDDFY